MMVSVVIPCYNEKSNIVALVKAVLASPVHPKEVVIVDDCSKDGTRELLEKEVRPLFDKTEDRLNLLFHEQNGGKGAALHTGFRAATGDIVLIQDADLEYDPAEYSKLLAPFQDKSVKVVYGSRFLQTKSYPSAYKKNIVANRFLTGLSNLFTHQKLTDMETCYKAFDREVLQSLDLKEKRFGFEPEVTAQISRKGYVIREVPISYRPRTNEEGKKIGWKDGIRAIYCIFRYRRG